MVRPFLIRFSSSCLSFTRCSALSQHWHQRLLSTTITASNNINDLGIHNAVPFQPHGTRGPEQNCSRRMWTKEEDDLLKTLYTKFGPKYTLIASHLPGRLVGTVFQRCKYFFDPEYKMQKGPWEKEEIDALRTLVEEAITTSKQNQPDAKVVINWLVIQYRLPYPRTLSNIKMTWYHTINPQFRRGRWTDDENRRFQQLTQQVGIADWRKISLMLGTRSPRQCLEKYRHYVAPTRKGHFTPQEDAALMAAVNIHGDGNFLKIKQVMESPRTPRQLAKHYRYALDPAIDRSPWTEKEKQDMYRLALQFDRDMLKVKEHMNSKRHVNDMWNHYKMQHAKITSQSNK